MAELFYEWCGNRYPHDGHDHKVTVYHRRSRSTAWAYCFGHDHDKAEESRKRYEELTREQWVNGGKLNPPADWFRKHSEPFQPYIPEALQRLIDERT